MHACIQISSCEMGLSLFLLVHRYALDDHFLCELYRGLTDKQAVEPAYAVSAPMLYESKHDGSFAAHATQVRGILCIIGLLQI